MLYFILGWPIVGLLTAVIVLKIDKMELSFTDFIASMLFGYGLPLVLGWTELHTRFIKKNPILFDFKSK